MKKLAMAVAALLVAPGIALADDNRVPTGFYISGGVGATLPEDGDLSGGGINSSAEYDFGLAGIGALGYRISDMFRGEFELGFRTNDVDSLSGVANASGELDQWSMMFNGLVDFMPKSRFSPYVGAGVGIARATANDYGPFGANILSDTDEALAYQGIAGVTFKFNDWVQAFADYRYFATQDYTFQSPIVGTTDLENASHNIFVGIRFLLSEPAPVVAKKPAPPPPPPPTRAAPPPPPEPEPAPPPPPPAPEIVRNFIVFFDWDSDALTPEAQQILRSAADYARIGEIARIEVTGHADRSGPDSYNIGLSERRARQVSEELNRLGISSNEIAVGWRGESDPLVITDDGVREPQNRRVEIIFP